MQNGLREGGSHETNILLTVALSMVLTVLIHGEVQSRNTGDVATFDLPGGATIEMVWIEPGTFMMGSPEDEVDGQVWEDPQHEVTISQGFYLGKYELTQGQWESVMRTRPWSRKRNVEEHASNPAVYISWEDVRLFLVTLNDAEGVEVYRLPTEAEWEFACRAGTKWWWSLGSMRVG